MKLKNIMKDVRQLRVDGKLVQVIPGETIEGDKIIYDKRVFEEVKNQNRNEKTEKPINKKEVSK